MQIETRKPRHRGEMIRFLENHTTREGRYSQEVKIDHCLVVDHRGRPRETSGAEKEAAGLFYDLDGAMARDLSGFDAIIERFASEYPGFRIETEGRSSGHLVLHHVGPPSLYFRSDMERVSTVDLRAFVEVVWHFDYTVLDATTAFKEAAVAWAAKQRERVAQHGENEKARKDWTSPPVHCPFCGGTNILRDMVEWPAHSSDDPGNTAKLSENQCQSCEGRSFWT